MPSAYDTNGQLAQGYIQMPWGPMHSGWNGGVGAQGVGVGTPQQQAAGDNSGKKAAPPPPDYSHAAQDQSASSRQNVNTQTQQNRPNINTPFATQSWTTGPDGTPQLTMGLAGGLGTGATALQNQFGAANANPLDPSLFGPVGNGDAARDQAITGAWNQSTSRLNPMWDQQGNAMQSQLAAQGLDPNSEAYRNASSQFGRDRNDAYTSAMNSAIGQGTQAGSAVFGQNLAAHNQGIQDAMTQRTAPLQMLSGLANLGSQMPSFNQAGLADPNQSLAAAMGLGNYNLANAQQQNEASASTVSGLLNFAGAAGGGIAKAVSDERLKTNIVRHKEEALPGVPFATWEWKDMPGARSIGVIAQDLRKVAPEHVSVGEDGYLRVDYSFLRGLS